MRRQGFDIIAAIFESIKRTFVQIFRWLAYLLDWDDIKTTTAALRKLIVNAVQNGQGVCARIVISEKSKMTKDRRKIASQILYQICWTHFSTTPRAGVQTTLTAPSTA